MKGLAALIVLAFSMQAIAEETIKYNPIGMFGYSKEMRKTMDNYNIHKQYFQNIGMSCSDYKEKMNSQTASAEAYNEQQFLDARNNSAKNLEIELAQCVHNETDDINKLKSCSENAIEKHNQYLSENIAKAQFLKPSVERFCRLMNKACKKLKTKNATKYVAEQECSPLKEKILISHIASCINMKSRVGRINCSLDTSRSVEQEMLNADSRSMDTLEVSTQRITASDDQNK